MAAFALQWQSLVVSENAKDSTKAKIFTIWFFKEIALQLISAVEGKILAGQLRYLGSYSDLWGPWASPGPLTGPQFSFSIKW